eukprot:gene3261-6452_t
MTIYNSNLSNAIVTAVAVGAGVIGSYFIYSSLFPRKRFSVVFVLGGIDIKLFEPLILTNYCTSGGPGAGKGTQSALIYEKFGYVHLSAGDLLREERNSGSELADMINTFIKEGKIVPAEVTVSLLRKAMEKSGSTKFLVDGFPRDLDNLRCWEEKMGSLAEVQFLLFLDCPQEIMLGRLLERGKTSGRNDDNAESIRKRFQTYEDSTRPIIEHFRSIGKIRSVEANRPVDAVFSDVSIHFQNAYWS